jgi:hypothetical protein
MNQPDYLDTQDGLEAISNPDINQESMESQQANGREWFPEDEDEWYEPDYSRKNN